jgi:single-stranded DNA-binding protein
MKGIHCALEGRLGQDVELRRTSTGKDWVRLSVGVGEGDELTWVSVSVFEEKARALEGVTKGVELYLEGRLTLNTWTGKDGQQRTGLSATAWRVEVLGQIGRRSGGASVTPPEAAQPKAKREELDDAIPF